MFSCTTDVYFELTQVCVVSFLVVEDFEACGRLDQVGALEPGGDHFRAGLDAAFEHDHRAAILRDDPRLANERRPLGRLLLLFPCKRTPAQTT